MTAAAITSRDQTLAGALAFATHVLLIALLVFGVSWQHKQIDTTVVVDLWRDLPPLRQPKLAAPKPPPPVVKPVPPLPPPPAPKVEAKLPPKPAPEPDIALKEKQEKERKLKEQAAAAAKERAIEKAREAEIALKEKQEKERKLKEQAAAAAKERAIEKAREEAAEKKKRAAAEALKKRQAAEAAAKRIADEKAKAREAMAAQQAAAQMQVVNEYKRRIAEKIKKNVNLPPNVNANAEVEFEIVVLPGGGVLGAKLKRATNSSPAYDSAVERAILKSQPLPLPPDPALMRQFRELNLIFRPEKR